MEIIGVLGFCFGSLGFILSTVPNVAKAGDAFRQCAQKFVVYRRRRTKCEAKFKRWKMKWQASMYMDLGDLDLGEHQSTIDDIITGIGELKGLIDGMVRENCTKEKEKTLWHRIRSKLSQNDEVVTKLVTKAEDLTRSIGYVLFTKELIEGWLDTLEKAVKDLETFSELGFQNQTADHFGTSLNHDQVEKIRRLKNFLETLKSSADSLYGECAKIPSAGWELGLRPPDNMKDLDNWDRFGSLNIELRLLQQSDEGTNARNLLLHARYQKEDPATHDYENQIQLALSNMAEARTRQGSNIECKYQSPGIYQLDAIGRLLETHPDYFKSDDWKTGRVDLVYGLVNWALLLWDTMWFERLCCFGLYIERGSTDESLMHTLNSRKCDAATHTRNTDDHYCRLRNLGVALAEIVLGKSIWLEDDSTTPPRYSEWMGNQWVRTYRSEIVEEVLLKSTSIPLCDAIKFCLEDDSPVAREPFEPGYLLRCIEKIHGPVKEWYKVESPLRASPAVRDGNRQSIETHEGSRQVNPNTGLTVQVRNTERETGNHPELRRKRRFPD